MRISDKKFNPYHKDNVEIYVDEHSFYSKWWEGNVDYKYMYSSDKSQVFSINDLCITMCVDNDQMAYAIIKTSFFNNNSTIDNHCFYIELKEFGMYSNKIHDAKLLFDYLLYYCKVDGAKYIKISKKEDFASFYEFIISTYPIITIDNEYFIKIVEPYSYDEYAHLKPYANDALSIDDILRLYKTNFTISKDNCFVKFNEEDVLSVDRKTGLISFPKYISYKSNKYLNEKNHALLIYIIRNFNTIKTQDMSLDNYIDNLPYNFAYIGNQKLAVFEEIVNNVTYLNTLLTIKNKTSFKFIDLLTVKYNKKDVTLIAKIENIDILKDINKLKLCLEFDNVFMYPSPSIVKQANAFNNKIDNILNFNITFLDNSYPINSFNIDFIDKIATLIFDQTNKKVIDNINKNYYINCLKEAYISTWKNSYVCNENNGLKWELKLTFKDEVLTYFGINKTPKIFMIFLNDLFKNILY